jgi:hypothetical protein
VSAQPLAAEAASLILNETLKTNIENDKKGRV